MYDQDYSAEHTAYLKKNRHERKKVLFFRIGVFVALVVLWQLAANLEWINVFITSSPVKIWETTVNLIRDGSLFQHLGVTILETVLGFLIGTILGTLIAVLLWWCPITAKVLDPYIVTLNALPKVALGPVIIVWAGAGFTSIMLMALLVSIIVTIIGVYGGFVQTEPEKITLVKSFGANKSQILRKVVLPSSFENIVNALKINVGLSWVGVIMGEFLVSKAGLGYLIMYGSQVFNLDLVMTGVVILSIAAAAMYFCVDFIEKRFFRQK